MYKIKKGIFSMLASAALFTNLAQAAPIINFFELGTQVNQENYYDEIGQMNISRSIADEEGTLAMYSTKDNIKSNLSYMFKIYKDDKLYNMHISSEQYKIFAKAAPKILTEHKQKTSIKPYFLVDKKINPKDNTIATLYIIKTKPN